MHHHNARLEMAGARLGAAAGPLSLLLLPKCPLCLIPLFGFLGLAIPATAGMWILAGTLVGAWLLVLFFSARKQPIVLGGGAAAGAIAVLAIVIRDRSLLWAGILAMTLAGLALSRMCAARLCARKVA